MTKQELIKILAILETAYPHFYKESNRDNVANLWYMQFKEYSYKEVVSAVHAYIATDTKGYAPIIGQIKDRLYKNTGNGEMTELQAWNIIYKAICNSGYKASEEFDKLPLILKSLVGSPGQLKEWSMMDTNIVNSVVSSNFQRSYKARRASYQENTLIPLEIKKALGIENLEEEDQCLIE